jgi:hypothetical protein
MCSLLVRSDPDAGIADRNVQDDDLPQAAGITVHVIGHIRHDPADELEILLPGPHCQDAQRLVEAIAEQEAGTGTSRRRGCLVLRSESKESVA